LDALELKPLPESEFRVLIMTKEILNMKKIIVALFALSSMVAFANEGAAPAAATTEAAPAAAPAKAEKKAKKAKKAKAEKHDAAHGEAAHGEAAHQ